MKFLLTALTAELKESPALEREAIACTSSSTRRDGHAADPGLRDTMTSAFLAVFRGSRKGGKYEPCRSFGMRKPSWTEPRVGCGDRPLARCPNEPRAGEDSRSGV